jgi:ABC-type sugar transport system permease subunit
MSYASPGGQSTGRVVGGLALVAPAFILLIVAYGWPAVWTVRTSFQRVSILNVNAGGPYTMANYHRAFQAGLAGRFGFALSLAVVPVLVALLAAPVLAWAAQRGGTGARWVTRGVLALPLAGYAPTAIVLARLASMSPEQRGGADPGATVRSLYWWGTFGLVAALATTLFLAALRQPARRSAWPAVAVAAGVAVLATVAAALQDFTYSYVSVVGSRDAATPLMAMYTSGFQRADVGTGAAAATVLLAVLCLLGLAATLAVVVCGARVEVDTTGGIGGTGATGTRLVPALVAGGVLLVVASLAIYGLAPLLGKVFGGSGQQPPLPDSTLSIALDTWAPPLLVALVSVIAAAGAAFGIGWLRPLGRHSSWLLLPFGPFLFVGVGPLLLHGYASARSAGRLDSFTALLPPAWIAVPALFVLTLLLRGQAERVDVLRSQGRQPAVARHLLWTLPMLAVVFLATWVAHAQDLLWSLIATSGDNHLTGPVVLVLAQMQFLGSAAGLPYDLVLPPVVFVVLTLLTVAAQVLYLDRVALRVGRAADPA